MWSDLLEALLKTFGPMAGLFVLLLAIIAYIWRQNEKSKDKAIADLRADLAYERGRNDMLTNEARDFGERTGQDRAREMRTLGELTSAMKVSVEQNREALSELREERRDNLRRLDEQRRDFETREEKMLTQIDRGMDRVAQAFEKNHA